MRAPTTYATRWARVVESGGNGRGLAWTAAAQRPDDTGRLAVEMQAMRDMIEQIVMTKSPGTKDGLEVRRKKEVGEGKRNQVITL